MLSKAGSFISKSNGGALKTLGASGFLTGCRFISGFQGHKTLAETDPEINDIIEKEKNRQWRGLELIASENFASDAVLEALGSPMNNKYAEGYPGARYYGGNEFIDQNERLCQKRALEAFGLDPEKWGVNVQPLSGSPANFAAYTAVLKPHDRIMGLDLPHGGHLTHGFQTEKKKISATSIFFESMPYRLNNRGFIDYDALDKTAALFRPKLIIAGASAYPRLYDYARMRKTADAHSGYLLADIAHISGPMAAGVIPSAFEHCDIVTTTTHKTLRGPRGGLIFYRKGVRSVNKKGKKTMYDLENKVNFAVFPALQGGPHQHQIASIAVALKEVMTPEFVEYQKQVLANAKQLCGGLMKRGYKMSADGTDTHLMLWDLRPNKMTGSKYEKLLEHIHMTVNKNSVVGDTSAMNPGGVRVGTPALTSRGMVEADMDVVADFMHRGLLIALDVQKRAGKRLDLFEAAVEKHPDIPYLRDEVQDFATQFDIPGFNPRNMKYQHNKG